MVSFQIQLNFPNLISVVDKLERICSKMMDAVWSSSNVANCPKVKVFYSMSFRVLKHHCLTLKEKNLPHMKKNLTLSEAHGNYDQKA